MKITGHKNITFIGDPIKSPILDKIGTNGLADNMSHFMMSGLSKDELIKDAYVAESVKHINCAIKNCGKKSAMRCRTNIERTTAGRLDYSKMQVVGFCEEHMPQFIAPPPEEITVIHNNTNKKKKDPISGPLRHEILKHAHYRCMECGAKANQVRLHIDHILPISQGGTDELCNLQVLCEQCNLAKHNRMWKAGE